MKLKPQMATLEEVSALPLKVLAKITKHTKDTLEHDPVPEHDLLPSGKIVILNSPAGEMLARLVRPGETVTNPTEIKDAVVTEGDALDRLPKA